MQYAIASTCYRYIDQRLPRPFSCSALDLTIMLSKILIAAFLATDALAHGDHEHQFPIAGPHKALWYNTLPGDGGTQVCQLAMNRAAEAD